MKPLFFPQTNLFVIIALRIAKSMYYSEKKENNLSLLQSFLMN